MKTHGGSWRGLQPATIEQFQIMLQNRLAQRFKLATHRDKKETQTYDLVVAKGGHKMKDFVPAPPPDHAAKDG